MRWVRTRVLPEPAPAITSSGEPSWTTALRCWSLSPSSRRAASSRRPAGRAVAAASGEAGEASVVIPSILRPGGDEERDGGRRRTALMARSWHAHGTLSRGRYPGAAVPGAAVTSTIVLRREVCQGELD